MIKVGCCGFPISRKKYYGELSLVEVQQTFYRRVRIPTLKGWRSEAPEGFEFTLKALQFITHPAKSPTYRKAGVEIPEEKKVCYGFFRNTQEVFAAYEYTLEAALALEAKVVIFQTPPSFKAEKENIDNMRNFFSSVERKGLIFGFEPRGKGWTGDIVGKICSELDLIHVVDPFKDLPAIDSNINYFRLHGRDGYRYKYSREELEELLNLYNNLESQEIYVLFNNTAMFENAREFKNMII